MTSEDATGDLAAESAEAATSGGSTDSSTTTKKKRRRRGKRGGRKNRPKEGETTESSDERDRSAETDHDAERDEPESDEAPAGYRNDGAEDGDGETDSARYELDKWSSGINRAVQRLRAFQGDLANVQVRQQRGDDDGSRARNAARGQRIRIINQAIALLNKYGEVLDPGKQQRVDLELMKQQIENEKRLENMNRRGPG